MSSDDGLRPFRFGLLSPAATARDWHRVAQRAEDDGYATLALTDHLDLSGAHVTRLAWVPALAAAAARTTRLRFTTMVANQDLRHPAVLARDLATLDVLSEGRFEVGLGAGWNEREYVWAGLPYAAPGVRLRRLAEYVAVVRGLLDTPEGETFSLDGEFFTITEMPSLPRPVQARVPLMLGGSRPKALALCGRLADIVNLNTLRDDGTAGQVLAEKLDWLREGAGERFDSLELGTSIVLVAPGTSDPVSAVTDALRHDGFARHIAERMPVETVADAAFTLAGSTAHIIETLLERRERWGLTYYVLPAGAMDAMRPVLAALAQPAR